MTRPSGATKTKDVMERKKYQAALKESEQRFRALIEYAPIGISIIRVGKLVDSNQEAIRIFGYTGLEEALGRPIEDFIAPSCRTESLERYEQRINGFTVPNSYEMMGIKKDGREFPLEIDVAFIQLADGPATIQFFKDVTLRKQAEETLRESQKRYRIVADNTHDWEFWLGPERRFLYMSASCERITGYTVAEFEADAGLFMKIVHPEDRPGLLRRLSDRESGPHELEFRIIHRDGSTRWIGHVCQAVYDEAGVFSGLRGSNRDITERKHVEDELLKARQLESVGTLAGGIAHDFNNLLAVMQGYIELIKMDIHPDLPAYNRLLSAERATLQAVELTQRLLTFSKGGDPIKHRCDIGEMVKDSVRRSTAVNHVQIDFFIAPDLWFAEVDAGQMQQVIRNLTLNAVEAMPEGGGLTVRAENVQIHSEDLFTVPEGPYIRISIEDVGIGIAPEDLSHIFDPYFSTKQRGPQKGMGLGLAVCYAVVGKHQGCMTVESAPGKGSVFHVYLPAVVPDKQEGKRRGGGIARTLKAEFW